MIKRIFDILFSLLFLIILSPLLLTISILVYIKLGSPILFKQMRPGIHGNPFRIYKFRTMINNTFSDGRSLEDQDRMTSLGTILRKYSLDELPEFWNVLKGDMSIVGPRPLLIEYLPLYSEEQKKRHDVKPGITGWAQINGRNNLLWRDKLAMDVWYVSNNSFWLDLKIILITALKVVSAKDISFKGMATTTRFKGRDE